MSYPIPHFKEPEADEWRLPAELAEAALANIRRYSGRPARLEDEPVVPPILTFPPLREAPVSPVMPQFQPSYIPPTMVESCGGTPPGFIITGQGLRLRD